MSAPSQRYFSMCLRLFLNCLLYANDVVLISFPVEAEALLQQREEHSMELDYRGNPCKCIPLSKSEATFFLYGTTIPMSTHFSYLGIPFKIGGAVDTKLLAQQHSIKTLTSMNILIIIDMNSTGFFRLLSLRICFAKYKGKGQKLLIVIKKEKGQ